MKKIKQFINSNRAINILLTSLLLFTIIYAFTCGFFFGSESEKIEQLKNYDITLTEKKEINNNISKKTLISSENNAYYADLYFDYDYNVYIRADIYYFYSVNENTGSLTEIETILDLEYTSIDSDLTLTYSYVFTFEPKINNTDFINLKDINYLDLHFNLVVNSQNYNYVSPQCRLVLSYLDSNDVDITQTVDLSNSILLENGYQWNNRYNNGFTIYDSTFGLFSNLYEVYYNLGLNFGIEIGRDYGYEEGYEIGFDDGEQKQIEKYEESGNIFENIWSFLEVGISTVLSVFSLEILPGIPLSICIIIPLVFGIIFFIWKGGAQ